MTLDSTYFRYRSADKHRLRYIPARLLLSLLAHVARRKWREQSTGGGGNQKEVEESGEVQTRPR